MNSLLLILLLPFLLTGCATLNRSECQNANWHIIGMEDGAEGLLPSNIGKHREACAKHNVIPDINEYRRGYDEGIKQFCTKKRAFDLGKKGQEYPDVCPEDIEDDFLKSYELGVELRSREDELRRADDHIQYHKKQIEKVKDEIKEKKQQLISQESTETQRADLLEDIEESQEEIKDMERKLRDMKREYEDQQEDFEVFEEGIDY